MGILRILEMLWIIPAMIFEAIFYLISAVFLNTRYLFWRLSGGVENILQSRQKKNLCEFFGLDNTYSMTAEDMVDGFISEPNLSGKNQAPLIAGDEFVFSLKTDKQKVFPMSLTIKKVFFVDPQRILYGCHGKYPLAKALFFINKFGGDPRCGGGIKYFSPPRLKKLWEQLSMISIKKQPVLFGYVPVFNDGANGYAYENAIGHNCSHMTLFLGKEEAIRSYAKRNEIGIKPVTVRFA